jgi:hypothetical protein
MLTSALTHQGGRPQLYNRSLLRCRAAFITDSLRCA